MSKEVGQGYKLELFQRVSNAFEIESVDNNKNIAASVDLIKKGYYPVIVSNHQSHVDGIPYALVINKIFQQSEDQINGFYMPIASSIETGDQGNDLKELIKSQKSILASLGLDLIAVTRQIDHDKFKIPYNNDNVKKIIRSPQIKFGYAFFPEGTVQGGRINDKTGRIYGMVKPENLGALDPVLRGCKKENKPFFFLPIGIDGSYKIVSPDHSKNGSQIDEFKMEKIMNFINVNDKAVISVGTPISSQEYEKFSDKADGLMSAIALLISIEARGVYAQSTRINLSLL